MRNTLVALVTVLLVFPGAVVALPTSGTTPDVAASGSSAAVDTVGTAQSSAYLELERAVEGDTDSDTVSFSFTADDNGSVSATDRRGDGETTFTFDSWSGGGDGGGSSSFTVEAGESYTVTYDVEATSEGSSGYGGSRSVTVSVSGAAYSSHTLYADVTYLEPEFGSLSADDPTVQFQGQDTETVTATVEIRNDGDGVMKPEEVTVATGWDLSASVDDLPSEVRAGRSAAFDVDITADESIEVGTHDVSVTLEDNLGNEETATADVEVRKVPNVEITDPEELEFGDVLVGTEESRDVTLTEITGYGSATVDIGNVLPFEPNATVDTNPIEGEIASGSSETGAVTLSVTDDAAQHEDLGGTMTVRLAGSNVGPNRLPVTGRVIYPAQVGRTALEDVEYTFDEPHGEGTYTERVTASVENAGDLPLEITDVSVRADGVEDEYVSVAVADSPGTVPGLESGELRLDVTFDSRAPAGEHRLEIAVETEDVSTGYETSGTVAGTETLASTATVSHETELAVDANTLEFGELEITQSDSRTVELTETLGYGDVENLSVERVDGPERGWLTVETDVPARLEAGTEETLVLGLEFDTDAEVLTEYTWEYRIDGDEVDPTTVTVTATPGIIDAEATSDALEAYESADGPRGDAAERMGDLVATLDRKIRDDDLDGSAADISRGFTAAESTVVLLEELEATDEAIDRKNRGAAQENLIRAAAAYNTVDVYVSQLEDPELRALGEATLEEVEVELDDHVEAQREHYRAEIDDGNASLLTAAITNRQLAQIAVLEGDDERAETLQAEADASFESYSDRVREGQEHLQSARDGRERLTGSTVTTVAGTPLVLNPANRDEFTARADAIASNYDAAARNFADAGADEKAQAIREERDRQLSALATVKTSMYAVTGVYVVGFLVVVGRLVRRTISYVRDANEAITGDFLV